MISIRFEPDTVGKPLPGMEVRIVDPDPESIGEVAVRSRTVMSHYLDDPEMTAETIRDGWLYTGDLGRFDAAGHLQLLGRKRNMIVTPRVKIFIPRTSKMSLKPGGEGILHFRREFSVAAAGIRSRAKSLFCVAPEAGAANLPADTPERRPAQCALAPYKRVEWLSRMGWRFSAHGSMKIKRESWRRRSVRV